MSVASSMLEYSCCHRHQVLAMRFDGTRRGDGGQARVVRGTHGVEVSAWVYARCAYKHAAAAGAAQRGFGAAQGPHLL